MSVRKVCLGVFVLCLAIFSGTATAQDLLVTNFFFNTVDRYDSQTGALVQSGFFNAPEITLAGMAGIAVDPVNNRVYASGRFVDRIYAFDGITGAPLPAAQTFTGMEGVFLQLAGGQQPAGLALDSSGNLYVANNGATSVDVFSTTTGAMVNSISNPMLLFGSSGLTFDGGGDLFITNLAGTGTLRYDGMAVTPFAAPDPMAGPFVPNGVVVDSAGNAYVADVFGNSIFKYDSGGTLVDTFDISAFIPAPDVVPSSPFAAPSGLLLDENEDLLVAVLGYTNPGEMDLNGALLRISSTDGSLLQTLGTKLSPLSGLVFAPAANSQVPEPGSLAIFAACGGFAWLARRVVRQRR